MSNQFYILANFGTNPVAKILIFLNTSHSPQMHLWTTVIEIKKSKMTISWLLLSIWYWTQRREMMFVNNLITSDDWRVRSWDDRIRPGMMWWWQVWHMCDKYVCQDLATSLLSLSGNLLYLLVGRLSLI